ncbi:pseudouridine-5'-phosphate glycosidase [Segnochrobactrum spirostomi]|uniref:Pseudouridine-5'-phosphate glycosidase n=1 Tax=Segnochrobactrum spirostomi TaxID=2608987 RepID=A0A6A7Y4V7_9HYPH|nr:pseudouridine-5'-phosphate glycosidase [Segnochrobactrum spirostomi]MQT13131.1 pseudouridine-5'-phosphate glycosidase [Segnochrobactrum spirostomi]
MITSPSGASAAASSALSPLVRISGEVRAALDDGRGLVALESTIITHGMPWPENLDMARAVEDAVRAQSAVPATIAVIDGHLQVGLDDAALESLARGGTSAIKVSRRDLAVAAVRKATGGTTVAATMIAAAAAGIAVFATGGIGGVHRGAETTFDISADLEELGNTPVAVVCAGAKSILDIPKTLEYLETRGVPVLGYRTDVFPAFFSRESGSGVDARFDSAAEIAAVIAAQRAYGLKGGILIGNPAPEEDALPANKIDSTIAAALEDADRAGIAGKDITPFLLGRIKDLSGGASLKANIALVLNNARLAGAIATELAALRRSA